MGGGQVNGATDGFTSYGPQESLSVARDVVLGEMHDHRIYVSDGFQAYPTSYLHDNGAERFLSGLTSFFAMIGNALKKAVSIFGSSPPSGPSSAPPSEGGEKPAAKTTITGFQRSREMNYDPNSWRVRPIGFMMMQAGPLQPGLVPAIYPRNLPLGAMNLSTFMISGKF